jgi:hypothetical protein
MSAVIFVEFTISTMPTQRYFVSTKDISFPELSFADILPEEPVEKLYGFVSSDPADGVVTGFIYIIL